MSRDKILQIKFTPDEYKHLTDSVKNLCVNGAGEMTTGWKTKLFELLAEDIKTGLLEGDVLEEMSDREDGFDSLCKDSD